jgi:hypothetical protein
MYLPFSGYIWYMYLPFSGYIRYTMADISASIVDISASMVDIPAFIVDTGHSVDISAIHGRCMGIPMRIMYIHHLWVIAIADTSEVQYGLSNLLLPSLWCLPYSDYSIHA